MSKGLGHYLYTKRRQAQDYFESWQSTVYSMVVFGATMVVIFWASVFLYTSFYFTFMPQESITWPIHFHYKSCEDVPGLCSNPSAVIPVLDPKRGSLLVQGQKYRVVVDLEMPESPVINLATRAASNLWLIDKAPIDEITGARLPSKEQVLLRYYHHHREMGKTASGSRKAVVEEVLPFWSRAGIPTTTVIQPARSCQSW
ncbi:Seipin [Chionoecetes opilio]|uniref:Seipin n=1 Tax=Chionoecetes opilio TaxID=41210 RepID=A0A8J4XWH0_CHIOP|nr:Seipin [Chionoecetes opilio]